MTLQSSGAISLSQVQTEFGGSNPVSMSEYYAGGTYVPSGTSGVNGSVPTSGTIAMSKFYGTSSVLVSFGDYALVINASGSGDVQYQFGSDGKHRDVSNSVVIGDWVVPNGNASNYEVKATVVFGTILGAATGSWLACTSSRTWYIEGLSSGTYTGGITVEVRPTGGGSVLDSASITFELNVDV